MAVTIPIPTADQAQQLAVNQSARRHSMVELPLGQKLAAVLLRLNPAVTPANYAAIGAAIDAITGIDGVSLLVDGQTPASIPEGTSLFLHMDVQLRIDDV